MLRRAGFSPSASKLKIWLTGCGTFQQYAFSHANPAAEILATDVSEASLKAAKKRCFFHAKRKVSFQTLNLEVEKEYPNETFDFIECYGVLMNLTRPEETLRRLAKRLK